MDENSKKTGISRRSLLVSGPTVAGTAALAWWAGGTPALAASPLLDTGRGREKLKPPHVRKPKDPAGPPSANGWPVEAEANAGGSIWTRWVNGSDIAIDIRTGDAATVLLYVVRRFTYEIDTLSRGDVVGFRPLGLTSRSSPASNLSSGTAVSIRPDWYPPGVSGGFFPLQLVVVRDILAECDGVVRWGGDDSTPNESLFYLDVAPGDATLTTVVRRIASWNATPGKGAGSAVDYSAPRRRSAAEALERKQRRS
jgi:hypothetical protein